MPITINGTSGISGVDGSAGTPSLKGSDTDTGISFATDVIIASTGGTERLRIDSSGRLGIGSASPSASLQVVGGNANQIIIDNGAGNNAAKYTALSSTQFASSAEPEGFCLIGAGATSTSNELRVGGALGELNAATEIVFHTAANTATRNGTERMRIQSDGQLRTLAAQTAFLLSSASSAGTSEALIEGKYSASSTGGGTGSFIVYTNGNVRNTNNSYGAISDVKLKENIVDAGSQWDDLKALQVRKYNFKEGQTHTQIGLVAQEVELISPGLVTESPDRDEDGNDLGTVTKSVNYSVLYMKAVKALQEAMERIESLETRLAALEVTP